MSIRVLIISYQCQILLIVRQNTNTVTFDAKIYEIYFLYVLTQWQK
jgi:hypothetical protein